MEGLRWCGESLVFGRAGLRAGGLAKLFFFEALRRRIRTVWMMRWTCPLLGGDDKPKQVFFRFMNTSMIH
jgi:hypothetical protein